MSYQNISSLYHRPSSSGSNESVRPPATTPLYDYRNHSSNTNPDHSPSSNSVTNSQPQQRQPPPPEQPKYHSPGDSLNMKWETLHYTNSADPNVWGPAFWFSLHNGAARYPKNASNIVADKMKGFIIGMPYLLPCESCAEHAKSNVERNFHRLDEVCSGRMKLFNFFVDFHNHVNKIYKKPLMSYEDAFKLYTSNTKVVKLKYD